MITSLETPAFKIQERFTSVGSGICSQASVSTAVAISEVDIPTVQLSIPRLIEENRETEETTMVNDCPVDLYVDSIKLIRWTASDAQNLYDIGIDISVAGSVITVKNTMTGVRSDIAVRNSAAFGCFFTMQHFLPRNYRPSDTLVGLLGTPNDNRGDDWISPDGTSYNPPANEAESIFSTSYQYCVENWCVRDESDSLFQYNSEDGESFETMFGCDKAYDGEIEAAVERAAVNRLDLIEVCGDAIFCILEGICGGIEEAAQVLMDEAILSANQEEGNPLPSTSPTASFLQSNSLVPSKMPSQFPTMSPTPFPTLDDCNQNAVITCISVIDESRGSQNPGILRARWEDFRKAYPERPFCLLQPKPNTISELYVPQAFFNDSRTIYEQVSRDRGSVSSQSDWFEVCNLENLRKQGIVDVAIFIDNSGSLTTSQVQASYNFLLSRMEEEGLNLVAGVSNAIEDWISPFLTDFGLADELTPCPVECDEGFGDCDGDVANGCETDLFTSVNGCGSCGVVCHDQESCVQGICVTNPSNATKCSTFDPAGNPYGIYSGVADQSNSGSYPVTITYNVSGIYTVYPTLSCGNILPIQPTLQEGELVWIEKIEFGGFRCINNGAVRLTVSSGAVWDYVWSRGSISVSGQLTLECV